MAKTTLFEKQDVAFTYNSTLGVYMGYQTPASFALAEGETYTVEWDDVVCDREGVAFPYNGVTCVGIGNPLVYGGEDNGDKFVIAYDTENNYMYFFSLEAVATHSVGVYYEDTEYKIYRSTLKAIASSIRSKTGSEDKMSPTAMPTAINGITGSGGGGTTTDERVKYVTFMYGDVELYKQPVIAGDTCKNPVTLGLIETPTKESTAQYDYTHSGWSLTDGGSATSYALTNVTEDRTVYAAFSAAVRYYTVTYYDEDGTTVLHTESLAYGSTPSYVPAKQDYTFDGWTPNTTVTGDTSYTASWSYGLDFANMTWAEIDAEIQAGNASKFAIGSQKSISYNYGVNARIMTLTIVGINHDDLSDGSGKAGITVDFSHPASSGPWGTTSGASNVAWNNTNYCYVGQYLSDLYEKYMPSDLKQVIKTVRKTRYDTGTSTYVTDDVTIFPPAIVEIMDTTNTSHRLEEGTQYVGYANGLDKNCWTRTKSAAKYAYQYDKSQTGDARAVSTYVVSNNAPYRGMFCI